MSRITTKVRIARQDGTVVGHYVLGLGEHIIGRDTNTAVYIDDGTISRTAAPSTKLPAVLPKSSSSVPFALRINLACWREMVSSSM